MDQDLSSDLSFQLQDEDAQLVSVPARVNRSDDDKDVSVALYQNQGGVA
jgi:hypothetical protein